MKKTGDLKVLVERHYAGLAPDLGECDPSDAVQPVMDSIAASGECTQELKLKLTSYDPETVKAVKAIIESFG